MTSSGADIPRDGGDACTIIIATLALAERKQALERAIRSLGKGNQAAVEIVVVVNGNRFDPEVVAGLRGRDNLRVVQIEEGSLSAAIFAGRQSVTTPFFGFLDDDDEYLPGAVDMRIAALQRHPEASIVATNGFRHIGGEDALAMHGLHAVEKDPLGALFNENWLASCGGLYRTKDLSPELFDDVARYLEWTWLAFRFASLQKKIVVLDRPTFRIHDSAVSESKSDAYRMSRVAILERLLTETRNGEIRRRIKSRIAQTWHDISCEHMRHGRFHDAWRAHVRSLGSLAGLKFLSYTRHLLFRSGG